VCIATPNIFSISSPSVVLPYFPFYTTEGFFLSGRWGIFDIISDDFILSLTIKGWKDGYFSKLVHYSAVGAIKRRLSNSLRFPAALVKSNVPTTKTCSSCGNRQKISLSERIFRCPVCGLEIDRDLNAAINMLKVVGLDRSEVKPVEWETAARIFRDNPCILVSHTT